MSDLAKLQRVLEITIHDERLFREALTHKSFSAEHNVPYDNQRLELLGDAVVQIIMTRYLFDRYPNLREGDLTKIRSALVNQSSLAAFARSIELGAELMLGKGEVELNGQDRDSTISDAFESLIGAIYLDSGLEAASTIFLRILNSYCPDPADMLCDLNPKGALQEYTQRLGMGVPKYDVVSVSGPDHDPEFEIALSIQDKHICTATASSRKNAERNAAKNALEILKKEQSSNSVTAS